MKNGIRGTSLADIPKPRTARCVRDYSFGRPVPPHPDPRGRGKPSAALEIVQDPVSITRWSTTIVSGGENEIQNRRIGMDRVFWLAA